MSEKSANALRTIGEVAEELGLEPHVLRFWETKFKQIKPQKRRGRRYYRPQDVKLVSVIKALLYTQGFTIKGAQRFLKQNASEISDTEVVTLAPQTVSQPTKEEAKEVAKPELAQKTEQSHSVQQSSSEATTRPRVNLRAASPASQLQPSLFAFQKAPANEGYATKEEPQQVAQSSTTEPRAAAPAKASKMSDGDKRRLREIYRGLCYTKEKLDEASSA